MLGRYYGLLPILDIPGHTLWRQHQAQCSKMVHVLGHSYIIDSAWRLSSFVVY